MAVSKEFTEAVDSGKKIRIKIMLKDIMLVDPTMSKFDEMLSYAAGRVPDLYDEHDGENLKYDSAAWNEAYLNQQMVTVVNNFSKERVELLRNMVKYLYKDCADSMRSKSEQRSGAAISRKQAGTGITAAGAVIAAAGICASEGIIVVGGIAVAAAGVAMIVTDKEN